jgi:Protein of unknown function (DUF3237)
MDLTHEFTFNARLAPAVAVGDGPFGKRRIREVLGGEVRGERISGVIEYTVWPTPASAPAVPRQMALARFWRAKTKPAADAGRPNAGCIWPTDRTKAGEGLQPPERGERHLTGHKYSDHYFRTAPRLECGDQRYAWVNQTLFVGEGRLHPGPVVEYRVHRVL